MSFDMAAYGIVFENQNGDANGITPIMAPKVPPNGMPGSSEHSTQARPPVPTDILDALRAATGPLHSEVDRCLPLARPSPSLADYRNHLRLLDAWMRRLAAFEPGPPPLDAHRRQLADDLRLCDALLPAEPSPHEAGTDPGTVRRDAAFVWGLAYVLEGSRLGGRVLYRQLAERLAPHPLNYLQGAGEQTGAQWKGFIAELRAQSFTPEAVRSACDGAVHAFDSLLQCHRSAEALA